MHRGGPRPLMRGGPGGPPRGMGGPPRGGFGRGGGSFGPPPPRAFVPHVPFDMTLCESNFPRVKPIGDDKQFTEALIKRNQELTPSAHEQAVLQALVSKVQGVLDRYIIAPTLLEAAQIEEVRQVGSHKTGTILAGHNTADIVVILRTLPTKEAVGILAAKVLEDLKSNEPNEPISMVTSETGFDVFNYATVKCLVTTIPPNLKNLDEDIHLDPKTLQTHLAKIRHTRWFEENAFHSSVKVLVRLLRDISSRYDGLIPLSPWCIDLLSHYSVMNTPEGSPLSINAAFRRSLQVLAAGLFLPGSVGIPDPCEPNNARIHTPISLEHQDQISYTAQTLLRVLAHGGYKQILGLEGNSSKCIATDMSVWDGVVVTPSDRAYEKPTEDAPEVVAAA